MLVFHLLLGVIKMIRGAIETHDLDNAKVVGMFISNTDTIE